jgi:hypothetical protein
MSPVPDPASPPRMARPRQDTGEIGQRGLGQTAMPGTLPATFRGRRRCGYAAPGVGAIFQPGQLPGGPVPDRGAVPSR